MARHTRSASLPSPRRVPALDNQEVIRAGDIVDAKWKIVRELGHGGMGRVFEAQHVLNGSTVALKIMSQNYASFPASRQRFLLEGALDNAVDLFVRPPSPAGPGVPRVYDSGETAQGSPYLAMELVSGTSAAAKQRTSDEVMHVMRDVARVLEGAHAQGIVHRDIKPQNIMINDHGDAMLIDFGLAQVLDDPPPGYFSGTPGFVPPEQVVGTRAVPESDLWALGAAAYDMLTGRPPMIRQSVIPDRDVFMEHQASVGMAPHKVYRQDPGEFDFRNDYPSCPVMPVQLRNPSVPSDQAAIVNKLLECNVDDRYQSAYELRSDLEAAIEEQQLANAPRDTRQTSGGPTHAWAFSVPYLMP